MTTLTIALIFNTMSVQFDLPKGLLESLCYVESKHQAAAIHRDDGGTDSIGICQLKLQTAREYGYKGSPEGLLHPSINAYFAALYLKHQLLRYDNIEQGIIAYNFGSAKHFTSTKYSANVIKQWNKWRVENGKMQLWQSTSSRRSKR